MAGCGHKVELQTREVNRSEQKGCKPFPGPGHAPSTCNPVLYLVCLKQTQLKKSHLLKMAKPQVRRAMASQITSGLLEWKVNFYYIFTIINLKGLVFCFVLIANIIILSNTDTQTCLYIFIFSSYPAKTGRGKLDNESTCVIKADTIWEQRLKKWALDADCPNSNPILSKWPNYSVPCYPRQ